MPKLSDVQFLNIVEKLDTVRDEIDLSYAVIIKIAKYHFGLREHLELFRSV